jgi:hypothetical protein
VELGRAGGTDRREGPLPPTPFVPQPAPSPQVLATRVRSTIAGARAGGRALAASDGLNPATTRLLNRYLSAKAQARPAPTLPPRCFFRGIHPGLACARRGRLGRGPDPRRFPTRPAGPPRHTFTCPPPPLAPLPPCLPQPPQGPGDSFPPALRAPEAAPAEAR